MDASPVVDPPAVAFAALADADMGSSSAEEALTAAEQARLLASYALAVEAQATARLAEVYPYVPASVTGQDRRRAMVAELQAAWGWSEPSTNRRVVVCERLAELPELIAALHAGLVDVPRAMMLAERVNILDSVTDRRTATRVVLAAHEAATNGLTTRQWAILLARTITAIDPDAAQARAQQTRSDREVRLHRPVAAGEPAALVVCGPAEDAAAADAAVDALARAWRDTGHDGTLAQLRHDAAIALLTGTKPAQPETSDTAPLEASETTVPNDSDASSAVAPSDGDATADPAAAPTRPPRQITLNLNMSLPTLLNLDNGPCELDRVGVIPASVARRLAAQATVWRRILTDPINSHVVTQQVRSYRPTEPMRQFVVTRTGGVCASRGCGHRAGLQLDHIDAWPHGLTSADNLAPFDQGHHENKTSRGWNHQLDPSTGAISQTTPLNRTYTTAPLPPAGATGPRAGPPTCPSCGTQLCPICDTPDCVPNAGPGCIECASIDYLTNPPDGWTMLDELQLRQLHAEQRETTDHDLIAEINTEELARLNNQPRTHDRWPDPDD